ncbi:hypothetical protein GCM10009737_05310 [Nocardioides lentus]|uniref:DUF4282 domain-containing protein n=1 Tax=Nocardioides lentus TaxID=338077 RepID=A0ABN2NZJ3_9ACTN
MSQYGSPPPSDPSDPSGGDPAADRAADDGRTRIPGERTPDPSPTQQWEMPPRPREPREPSADAAGTPDRPGATPAPGGWDEAPGSWQQPAERPSWSQPSPYGDESRTRATEAAEPRAQQAPPAAAPAASYGPQPGPYGQPSPQGGWDQQQPGPQAGWDEQHGQPAGPQTGWSSSGPAASLPGAGEAKGFVGALLDFSFSTFVTPMIVRFVYLLAVVALGLGFLFSLVVAVVSGSVLLILATLVLGPVLVLIYLCFIRLTLELYLAITRMSEDVHRRLPDPS